MATVTSEEVRQWWPLIETRATRLNGVGGAEFDDLVQEGAIRVWQELEKGYFPDECIIDRALIDYIRYWSCRGRTNRPDEDDV